MKKVLEIRHLTKRYGQNLALDNVNLTLEKGEVYGLIGRNGAGKTTLIKVITKLIRPSQGSVSLFHSTSKSEWTHALKRVGSVIETPVALNHLNAHQNLRYYCKIHHVAKPDLLILDEPINGLDPVAIKEFRQMIKKLSEEQGMTVLISSHILSELYQVSTRFGIIDHGHIIREITKDEFEHLSEDYIVLKTNQLALASRILQDQLHQHFKVVNSENEIHIFDKSHVIKAIVKELVKQEVDIDEIYYKRQDLENYFTQLVDSERR